MVPPIKQSQKKSFKEYAEQIPNLHKLAITTIEWSQLLDQSKKQKVTRLSSSFILRALSDIRSVDYDDLIGDLTKKQPQRSVKHLEAVKPIFKVKRRCTRQDDEDTSTNTFIFDSSPITTPLHNEIEKTGVRVTTLEPATPIHGYPNVKRTPGRSQVYGVYMANNTLSLFKPLTPYKQGNKEGGMVNVENASGAEIEQELPRLTATRLSPVRFEATLPKLIKRHHKKRGISQNTLMKASCREVFVAHGIETNIKCHGSDYHWAHLIAHFLGGAQSGANLTPSTAAANLNTLEVVEQFIAAKLKEGHTSSIDILAEPIYSGESLIPNVIMFNLSWMESNKKQVEIITINPRSDQRITTSMRKSITFLRKKSLSFSDGSSDDLVQTESQELATRHDDEDILFNDNLFNAPFLALYPSEREKSNTWTAELMGSNISFNMFKPFAPNEKDVMVKAQSDVSAKIGGDLPLFKSTHRLSIHFEATLANPLETHQNALMNSSCDEVFIAQGVEINIKSHDSNMSWADLFGRTQGQKNITSSMTATLSNPPKMVELFILEKLKEGKTSSINVIAEPFYLADSLTPIDVIFKLSWMESNKEHFKKITMDPLLSECYPLKISSSFSFLKAPSQTDGRSFVIPPPPLAYK